MHRRKTLCALAALALAAAAGAALAHDDSVLDLEDIEALVDQRAAETTGKDLKLYKRLRKAVAASSKLHVSKDLAKLVAIDGTLPKLVAPDGALAALVQDAADAGDAALGTYVGRVEQAMDRVRRKRDRAQIEKLALAAHGLHAQAEETRNLDAHAGLRGLLTAAKKYDQALDLAARSIRRKPGPLPLTVPAEPGKVYTVVGTGAGGFDGDGLPGRRTTLYYVADLRFGPDGLLYFLDWNNHMVRCVDADGTVRRICGAGTPGDSEGAPFDTQLNHPTSMVFAPDGRLFIAAWHNHKVKVWDPNAEGGPTVYTIAGGDPGSSGDGGLATDAHFNLLPGIARYPNGDLLVTDASGQVVRKIALSDPRTGVNVAGVTVTTGIVDVFAGTTGVAGYDGDGGPATSAHLTFNKAQDAEPDGRLEIDAQGNVYVACGKGHVVRRITTDGKIHTFAGTGVAGYSGDGGPAVNAQLDWPADIAVAPDGTVFISESGNNLIRKVAPDGTISTYAGGLDAGYSGDGDTALNARFRRPDGIELDSHGNLWVCDRYNDVIRVIAAPADTGGLQVPTEPYRLPLPAKGAPPTSGAPGTIDTLVGTPGVLGFNGDHRLALDTQLYWPQDCAADPQFGHLHFLDWNNHRVRRLDDDGRVTTVVGSGELGDTTGPALDIRMNHPTDIAFHPATGELWIAAWHTDKVLRLQASDNTVVYMAGGARTFSGDGGPPAAATMALPSSVKFDAAGNWYVSDEGNRRIRRVDAALDRIDTICGNGDTAPLGDGGPAADATLNFPVGQAAQPGGRICLSPDDRWLYVADTNNHRVRRIDLSDPDRTITTVAGDGTAGYVGDGGQATSARLRNPADVDCDAQGNLFICDSENHAIRRVDAASHVITTVAGTGEYGFSGDGGPATSAKLYSPSGIFVVRGTGRIYVADTYNGVVRVIWE